jgi:CHAD domain-containing protein
MARASKWITETSADQPLSDAAREALAVRLEAVWDYLEAADKPGADDFEPVHQLRVWSRRAAVALDTFRDVLPRRRARWFRRQLRRLRRVAGEARDLDVMRDRIARRDPESDETVALVVSRIHARRHEAQGPIAALRRRLKRKGFDRRARKLVERIHYRGAGTEPSYGLAARAGLRQSIARFFEAADGDLSDVAGLHEFRLAGKRLRYALEVYAGAFSAVIREELYPLVEELQEKLGGINDHATAAACLSRFRDESSGDDRRQLARLLATEQAALRRARRAFLEWWTPERAGALRRGFASVLSASATKAG